jgi:hypothetical protein
MTARTSLSAWGAFRKQLFLIVVEGLRACPLAVATAISGARMPASVETTGERKRIATASL